MVGDRTGWLLTWQGERSPLMVTGEMSAQCGNSSPLPLFYKIRCLIELVPRESVKFLGRVDDSRGFVTTKQLFKSFPEERGL